MAQLSDDCFAFDGPLMPLADALARLSEVLTCVVAPETVPLDRAVRRVAAAPVAATRSVPPYRNSAVDGYAVRHADLRTDAETVLPLHGRVAAGHPLDGAAPAGTAVRIFTGAPMPVGPDTVMMQEDCVEEDGAVRLRPGIKPGANVRDAGEDVAPEDVLVVRGHRLRPQDIGLLAAQGLQTVTVYAPLRVGLLSTGDEIVEPGPALPDGKMFDSNRLMLRATLSEMGFAVSDYGIVEDDDRVIADAMNRAAADCDVIVTSGGMSTGEEDHIKAVIEASGSLNFWRLAIKPGRPVGLGHIAVTPSRRVPVIGLPGNPVAAFTTFGLLGRPLLQILSGQTAPPPLRIPAVAGFDYKKKRDRREFVRVRVGGVTPDGRPILEKFGRSGAAILSSLAGADGFAELGESVERLEKGMPVDYLPFSELSG